jgi:hypothetical protein
MRYTEVHFCLYHYMHDHVHCQFLHGQMSIAERARERLYFHCLEMFCSTHSVWEWRALFVLEMST